ncbi:MAG: hypothetical protein A3G43_09035 [Ignavibacteria bacterium RIFCSPLOWO2_12_FULL_56_21]|nr:MAG: hypothetical protein A2X68_10775 [Ignavibacteria bacterium GWC2_56_12]OGU72478.1 MAG: hypothetical protein A3G43_09035 [Ignavibacteria bacterium RIFCSPLOWO2_12_FULL_56_21]
MKILWLVLLAGVLNVHATAQVQPTNVWMDCFSQASTVNGQAVPIGALVQAYDPQGVLCGEYRVQTAGWYGYLHVYGDDATTTGIDEGAVNGDTITFRIEGLAALASANAVWTSGNPGALLEVHLHANLSAPPPPQLISPADGATETPRATVLRWALAPEPYPSLGVLMHRVQVATDSAFGSMLADSLIGTADSLHVSGLAIGTLYHWRVRYEHDLAGPSVYSAVRWFATVTTGIEDGSPTPVGFELRENYPNPFNPETKIEYRMKEGGWVKVSVFDVLGREVAVLVDEEQPAGDYRTTWNASTMPSGVYLCRVTSLGISGLRFEAAMRMVLMR